MKLGRQISSKFFNRNSKKTSNQSQTSDSETDISGDIKKEKIKNFNCFICGQKGPLSKDCKKQKRETDQTQMTNLLKIEIRGSIVEYF